MAAIAGMRGTGSFSAQERPTNFRQKILYEYPDGPAVLTMILGMLKNEVVNDPKFTIFEKPLPDQEVACQGVHNNAVTTITLDQVVPDTDTTPSRKIKPKHVLRNRSSGEVVYVTAVPTDTTLTVVRGWGTATVGATGSQMDDHSYLDIIGSAHEEGANTPEAISFAPDEIYNYLQTFRTSMSLTGTTAKTYYRTGDINKQEKFEKSIQHAIEMEKGFLWGVREKQTLVAQPIRTTGGLAYWIDNATISNVADFSGGFTQDGWNDFLRPIYTGPGASQNKIALVGATALQVLNDYAEAYAHVNVVPGDKSYGMTARTLYHAFGKIELIQHPLMSENAAWTQGMFVVDTRNIAYRYLSERDTRFLKERQGNGEDKVVHEFLTECGLELQHARTHGYATGIANFIA